MNTRLRMCQDIQLYSSDQHWVTWMVTPPAAHFSTRLCTKCHQDAESLPSESLTSLLPLTLHFGILSSLKAVQGLKHQFCLAHVLEKGQEKRQMAHYCIHLNYTKQAYCGSQFSLN